MKPKACSRWLVLPACWLFACGTPFGIYHRVESGQNLYRIAQAYDVEVEKLRRINRINNPTTLREGELLFVPGAEDQREVVPASASTSSSRTPADTASKPKARTRKTQERARMAPKDARTSKRGGAGGGKREAAFAWPVRGEMVRGFGKHGGTPHDGVDVAVSAGTPVKAAADGRVIYSDNGLRGYGNLVIVKHSGCFATVYAHNRRNLVDKGDFVQAGQVIAEVGETGRASGPHLHFEVRCGKSPRDPLQYLPKQ